MKKKLTFLLTTLVLALVLCVSAAAAETTLTGTLGDSGQLSWRLEEGALSIQADQPWTGQVMAACYQGGRFSQVRVLTPDQPTAQVGDQVNLVKLFWLGEETFAPQCAPAQAPVAPDKVFTGGISLYNAINRSSVNYVAPNFAPDCEYYLNGNRVSESGLNATNIGKRGTVVEFYLNGAGLISTVKAYAYTVDKVEGAIETQALTDGTVQVRFPGLGDGLSSFVDVDKVSGWEDLEEGDVVLYYVTSLGNGDKSYTIEKAEMITSRVSAYSSAGKLLINGGLYRFSQQEINYVDALISEEIFKNWISYYNLGYEFDFFLDKNGDIAVVQQLTVPQHFEMVCLVAGTQAVDPGTDDSYLAVKLVFEDGSTERDSVSKIALGGGELKSVVEVLSADPAIAASQITIEDAQKALTGGVQDPDAMKKFFHCRTTDFGYELTELCAGVNGGQDWEDVVTTSRRLPVTKTPVFAQSFGLTADSQTVFIVGKRNSDGDMVYHSYTGFQNVPEMDATRITAIATNSDPARPEMINTVAKYVYLEAGSFQIDPPDGYILITSNEWMIDPDLYEDEVYLVNIADTDGTTCKMRVDWNLMDMVRRDSTRLNDTTNTIFQFWAVQEIDENGVVSALGDQNGDPAELSDVVAMGQDIISLANGKTYAYDIGATKFIYVDLGWADDLDDVSNRLGEREPYKDIWAVNGSGTFDPETFFHAADVDPTGANSDNVEEQNPNGASYISVQAAVIADPNDNSYADYVYVLRYLW